MAMSYMLNRGKNVVLLNTNHKETAASDGEKRKPVAILDYNKCKDGVNNLDRVVATYCGCWLSSTMSWMSQHTIPLSCAVHLEWESTKIYQWRVFLEGLGHMLVTPAIARWPCTPDTKAAIVAGIQQSESENDPQPTKKKKNEEMVWAVRPQKNGNHLFQLWKLCLQRPLYCGLNILLPFSTHTHEHTHTNTHTPSPAH